MKPIECPTCGTIFVPVVKMRPPPDVDCAVTVEEKLFLSNASMPRQTSSLMDDLGLDVSVETALDRVVGLPTIHPIGLQPGERGEP